MNLGLLLSGRGTNFEAIAAAIKAGKLSAQITIVGSNNPDAIGLQTARGMGIPTMICNRKEFSNGSLFADFMLGKLKEHKVDLIVLAGYLRKLPPTVIERYRDRIVNIHPALLPRFGGKGMYGINVHRAVIESGDKESGVTVHYVNEIYDGGAIIDQKRVPVNPSDNPESLAARILKVEHEFYPQVLQAISKRFDRDFQSDELRE